MPCPPSDVIQSSLPNHTRWQRRANNPCGAGHGRMAAPARLSGRCPGDGHGRPGDDRIGRKSVASRRAERSAMPAAAQQRQPCRCAADRRRRPPRHPQRPMDRPDLGARAGLCAGQSRDPARRARLRFHALLPAQSEALPAARGGRARRSSPAVARRGPRHPHRPLPLQGVPQRRTGRRADRHHQALARRSGDLRARLLVLVRGCADAGRHRAAPHHQRLDGADVSHQRADHRRRPVPRTAGGVDAAAEARRRDPRRPDHDALSRRARRAGASSACRS